MASPNWRDIYDRLLAAYGPSGWWPGDSAFEIMVGAVLTQNTAWANVEKAIANLRSANLLSPQAIIDTRSTRLAKLIRPSGYFNVKTKRLRALCHWVIDQGGIDNIDRLSTGELRAALLEVHGVGPETADDILLYAFRHPVFVIDTYTRRIFSRLGSITGMEDYEALRKSFEVALGEDTSLYSEYHALIVRHAKDVCRKKPLCQGCCLAPVCSYGAGISLGTDIAQPVEQL
ncbi:MAG: endonuclease III domain-containing protein [Acidiferrobacterales bacterium]